MSMQDPIPLAALAPIALPALESNYIWLLPIGAGAAWVVDPGEAEPVLEALERLELSLEGILITHHHWDHTDGLEALLRAKQVPVYGPDSVPEVSRVLVEGDQVDLSSGDGSSDGPSETLEVLAVPGHTLDHLAYYQPAGADRPPRLFCGDALFAAGCGRLLGGSASQAFASLGKMNTLPGETRIYCAHEYTVANLQFALTVDPDNPAVTKRLAAAEARRARGEPTLPSQLTQERATNPYLRTDTPSVRAALGMGADVDGVEVFTELRHRKDRFR